MNLEYIRVLVSTFLYAIMGVTIMLLSMIAFDKILRLDLRKELVEDQNIAFGILFAGISVSIAIIIASSIVG